MKDRIGEIVKVYTYIQDRYEYYDREHNGGEYSGEKFTNRVFHDAATEFNYSLKEVNELYSQFSYDDAKQAGKLVDIINKVKNNENIFDNLNGKKVKINVNNYLKNKKAHNKNFLKFIEDSKDKVFTAKTHKNDIYELEGVDFWLFNASDLIVVED